jgi:glycosyltransferase involved in cell wall biosynthesis
VELLQAAQLLALQHPDWRWILAGDGDRASVLERVVQLGLQRQVSLPGHLSDPAKHQALAQADLLVLPSWAEGQPLAVLEAMAWAVPVVATNVGDVPDMLACGAGTVVPPRAPMELARAIECIVEDRSTARRMGELGRAHVARHHSPQAVARELSALYRELGLRPIGEPARQASAPVLSSPSGDPEGSA